MKEKKKVFDHTRAENGGVVQLQNKSLWCSSQRTEKPRLEGQKVVCGLQAALCPP